MEMFSWIISNKELLKIFYALVIGLICAVITIKAHRLFRLSEHQGIRYFRNAFFFYGVAFLIRYVAGAVFSYFGLSTPSTRFFFEFFLIMGGFFLLYSLIWKNFEKEISHSSLFNKSVFTFYAITLIIVSLDMIWNKYAFMFLSQVLVFTIASFMSYKNYVKDEGKHEFLKIYFSAMVLSLAAWVMNFILTLWVWHKGVLINIYALNVVIFLVFLYGVIKVTQRK